MVRGKEKKKEEPVVKKFTDMTEAEKREAFDEWVAKRDTRRGQSSQKRKAAKVLMDKYPEEYAKLLKAAGGTVKG